MTESSHVTYEISFPSVEATEAGIERLKHVGFAVERITVAASLTKSSEEADVLLDNALTGIEHDPVIGWHSATLTGFLSPSSEPSSEMGDPAEP